MHPTNSNRGYSAQIGQFIKQHDTSISKVLTRSLVAAGTIGAIASITGQKVVNTATTVTVTTLSTLAGVAYAKVLPKGIALPFGIFLPSLASRYITLYTRSDATIIGEVLGCTAGILSETGHPRFKSLSAIAQRVRAVLHEADSQLCNKVNTSVTAFADYLIDAPPSLLLPF